MDNIRNWYKIPRALFRLCFILVNNVYCIPTYVVWMVLLSPLRKVNPDVYWRIEGYFFHWLLAMVSMWSWSAGYDVVEMGDDIAKCIDDRTLVIANHQSTGDVPLLMATFNPRKQILPNIMWIMDSLFKYTNFGIVSVLHQDFFIMSGKSKRDKSLQALVKHLQDSYLPCNRKWMVLFPEGGFLRKRKAVSQKYALKNGLPMLNNVSLPRVGAMHSIMETVGPKANNNASSGTEISTLRWILDITIAYPKGEPIDLAAIVFGHRPPCKTFLFYRLYQCKDLPEDSESLTSWLFERWQEKERMLESFYQTGEFPGYSGSGHLVEQDYLRYVILHLFFIISTYIHVQIFQAAYHYCTCLIY
ncbi:acyl-CoA:lysophosphatidylglycerol acyltransferase 1 isoform X1 [Tribolium castaneum]|uniref:Acyl-CoA:lysophosphatidylglycerol acyltransferase 1-like Protein n=2 Tax=Tribolium castaneum TaxID=7070 RepID=D2A1V8_TRICA|nr:PREDICTED: acyl-CoA:lysophosphatidylglycerol acyltransferase 1 [Tribolium castaneum]EFA02132.1 Acyl-CoA:lysophosphatidylglycerol acyltransferase 1-like Protein [Tribolium castaneum]|eukprot:XP_008191591.1 PREDICTED: acyl-CoA:lysophosphatidylglycerol acyltransferase 1 [Tribolium castaneum]